MTIKDFKKVYTGDYEIYTQRDGYPVLLYSNYNTWLSEFQDDTFLEDVEIFNLYVDADPPSYRPFAVIQIESFY